MTKKKLDVEKIMEVVSGEKILREKEEKIKKAKVEAVKEAKDKRRKDIIEGVTKLEKDEVQEKKVVQNIKLYEWSAPDRYKFDFDSKSFLIIVAISLAFSLFLAILGKYMLMIAILSLLFLIYVAGTTKPMTVKHKITARGIDTGGRLYEWFLLEDFYITKKNNVHMLIVNTKLHYPSSLILLLKKKEVDTLFVLLQDKLLYKDIRKWRKIDEISYGEYISLEEI